MPDSNPWAWREGRNPYRDTAFQILDVPLELRGRGAIKNRIKRRRQRILSAPARYPLFGEVLTEGQVNAVADDLFVPETRLLAELRMHRPRRARLDVAGIADNLPPAPPLPERPPVRVKRDRLVALVPPLPERNFPSVLPW